MLKPTKLTIILGCCVFLLALGLRLTASNRLKIDYDEPIYINAALEYTDFIRSKEYTKVAWNTTNIEHPALYKIMYGIAYLGLPPVSELYEKDLEDGKALKDIAGKPWVMTGRYISAVLGALTAGILGIFFPIAGFFVSVNALSVKYTSQVYLEALPLITSLMSALTYLKYFNGIGSNPKHQRKNYYWLTLSAVFLGATAAAKYLYCIVGIAIVIHQLLALITKQIQLKQVFVIISWGILAVILFFLFNPMLWPHPISRLVESVTFHMNYPSTTDVTTYNYPFFQPIRWLSLPFRYFNPKPVSAFLFQIDWLIFGLSIVGLPGLFSKNKYYFIWLIVGLLTLLVWGTKWPQYILIIMLPFCMSAEQGLISIYNLINRLINRLKIV